MSRIEAADPSAIVLVKTAITMCVVMLMLFVFATTAKSRTVDMFVNMVIPFGMGVVFVLLLIIMWAKP